MKQLIQMSPTNKPFCPVIHWLLSTLTGLTWREHFRLACLCCLGKLPRLLLTYRSILNIFIFNNVSLRQERMKPLIQMFPMLKVAFLPSQHFLAAQYEFGFHLESSLQTCLSQFLWKTSKNVSDLLLFTPAITTFLISKTKNKTPA